MKNNRDLLLTGFHLAIWAGLYSLGYAEQMQIMALALLAIAYFLAEWVQKSKSALRLIALFLGNGLIVYSLPVLKTLNAHDLLSGLLVVAYSLSYFLQFNAFRKSTFRLYPTRRKKWASAIYSALVFGLVYLLVAPDFALPGTEMLTSLPGKIQRDLPIGGTAAGIYGIIFLFLPNIGMVGNKKQT